MQPLRRDSVSPSERECKAGLAFEESESSDGLLRAPPLNRDAIPPLLACIANQLRSPAAHDRISEAIEAPLRILIEGAVVFLWKARFCLAGAKARPPESVDQAPAGNSIQGRNVQPDTWRQELFVLVSETGKLNKTVAKAMKQVVVCGVVTIVTRSTAGDQERRRSNTGRRDEKSCKRNDQNG